MRFPPCSHLRSEISREPQEVRKDAPGGDLWPGAGTLDDQRISAVPTGREAHDIVREGDVGKRVLQIEFDESDGGLARRSDAANVTQHFAARTRRLEAIAHLAVELRELRHELIDRA